MMKPKLAESVGASAVPGWAAAVFGLIGAGLLLVHAATPGPIPPESPPEAELPDYLDTPLPPPPPPGQIRPRQLPVPPPRRTALMRSPAATGGSKAVVEAFPLVFDAEVQEVEVPGGATNATFNFRFTNSSPEEVILQRVSTSCGCTTARLPEMPWTVAPDGTGGFEVSMDIRGKRGQVGKRVYLYTDKGFKSLTVQAVITDTQGMSDAERLRNLQLAVADRQAVFRGECASCHAVPAQNKQGRALFQAACAVCHEAEHRADMVPDLRRLKPVPDRDHWRQWVTYGKADTLMPAFARSEGGPLTPEQIDSLVEYLSSRRPFPLPVTPEPPVPSPSE